MEVKMGGNSSFGVSGHGGAKVGEGGAVLSSRPAGSTLNDGSQGVDGSPFTGLLGAGGLGLGFLTGSVDLGNGISIPGIGGILQAVRDDSNFNVLSSPNILTTDNQEAEIIVGQTVSVPKNILNANSDVIGQDFDRQEANLELRVTPQINDGDEITLQVEQIINEPIKSQFNDLSKRKAKTTIIAQNGQTVVIGGLIKDKESSVEKKVPILGDVPIIGSLFKNKATDVEKVNLMVFLTPTILRDAKDMSRISVQKNKQRREFNKANNVQENKGLYDYGFNETMNMAPVNDVQEVSHPQQVQPQKRFDYMQDEGANSSQAPVENTKTLRGRYSTDVEGGVYAGAPEEEFVPTSTEDNPESAEATNTNPFANVRPN